MILIICLSTICVKDNNNNIKLPDIIIKETKNIHAVNFYYELIFSQNKFIFDNNHPLIVELIPNAFIIGFEQNKIKICVSYYYKRMVITNANDSINDFRFYQNLIYISVIRRF